MYHSQQIWTPPTPPREDEDEVYVDSSLLFLYETEPLTEAHLPELYLTKYVRFSGPYLLR